MDFQKARKNMVDCQIHTGGVILPALLAAFETVPRERFVPESAQGVSCVDESLPLEAGRFLLEPLVQARMIQALAPQPTDVVLDIAGAGYSSALLSSLVSTVVMIEESAMLRARSAKIFKEYGYANIVAIEGQFTDGAPHAGPYDGILINGAVTEVPRDLLSQLAPKGRLVALLKTPKAMVGTVVLFENNDDGTYKSSLLFDSAAHYVPGFTPAPAFMF